MQAVLKVLSGMLSEGLGKSINQLTRKIDWCELSKQQKLKNSLENQKLVGEMSIRYHYKAARISEATERYLWNTRRRNG